MDVWQMVQVERAALVARLTELTPSEWDRPSLCENWSVRDVVAHLIASASCTPTRLAALLVINGFRLRRVIDKQISDLVDSRPDRDLLEMLRRRLGSRTSPTGSATMLLGEVIVHGEDVLRAVGRGGVDHPLPHLVTALNHYKNDNSRTGAKRRLAGLTLRATDAPWRHGSGPEVTGPALALLLAITGRAVLAEELAGPGAATLRDRLPATPVPVLPPRRSTPGQPDPFDRRRLPYRVRHARLEPLRSEEAGLLESGRRHW